MTNFIGDDLIDIYTINRPIGAENITIIKDVISVGSSLVYTKDNPTYPWKISILRTDSKKLDYQNETNRAIYYLHTDGTTVVRRTCIGSLNLATHRQVVPDVEVTED